MSKLSTAAKAKTSQLKFQKLKPVVNFMGGTSYKLSPLQTLKIVASSSIFGEPAYYREGEFKESYLSRIHPAFKAYSILNAEMYDEKKTTSDVMISAIKNALDFDFGATLEFATELRSGYYMRLNPQVILVEAAKHPKRAEWTTANPGKFNDYAQKIMMRADEPASQLSYYLYTNEGKSSNIPNILKKAWATKLASLNKYLVAKYKNAEAGMINVVRLSHANSPVLDELMSTGTVKVDEEDMTWENLKSEGKTWKEILSTIKLGHMALLRNLRNIFTEINDVEYAKQILGWLKAGVLNGKQFPFRYWSAYNAINETTVNHKVLVLDALEECIDISLDNMPKLSGKTMALSDNSGSAWGAMTSEYGSTQVAVIDNLSSLISAVNSDEGYVGIFGDKLAVEPASKRNGLLTQLKNLFKYRTSIGGGTENGIWLFFDKAIKNKEHWDNIFIYSDMQAGHGGLYGTHESMLEYTAAGYGVNRYVDVAKLIAKYRKTVNPKVNVFSVQTAGYDNVVFPEYGYRTNILSGWTGKELVFAAEMNKFWDEYDLQKVVEKQKVQNN